MTAQILPQRWFHLSRFIASAFHSASLRDCYDSTATYYEKVFGDNQNYYSDLIVDILKERFDRRFQNALDLGAGTGILTRKLPGISQTVCGIDFSNGMLQQAKAAQTNGSRVEYVAGNIVTLPFRTSNSS